MGSRCRQGRILQKRDRPSGKTAVLLAQFTDAGTANGHKGGPDRSEKGSRQDQPQEQSQIT
jgi:hypothetical protein